MREEALKLAHDLETHDKKSLFYSFLISQSADMIRKLVDELDCWKLTAQHHEFMSRHLGMIAKEKQEMLKPLSDEQIKQITNQCSDMDYGSMHVDEIKFAREIEKAHGIV